MLTVIIPVLNKLHLTKQIVKECKNLWIDYDMLIINNWSNDWTKEWLDSEWINTIHLPENIWVNPAWNLWAKESKTEFLLFLNNDILIPKDLWKKLIEAHSWWITCPKIDNWDWPEWFEQNINWTCFLIKKSDYIEIPKELVIFFGDDWLFRKLPCKFIDDSAFHLWSQTVLYTEWVHKIWEEDQIVWKQMLKENNWKDLRFN